MATATPFVGFTEQGAGRAVHGTPPDLCGPQSSQAESSHEKVPGGASGHCFSKLGQWLFKSVSALKPELRDRVQVREARSRGNRGLLRSRQRCVCGVPQILLLLYVH